MFQCSSASRKFLNLCCERRIRSFSEVSVLFSEPKIPQFGLRILRYANPATFQCSSASRKFLNPSPKTPTSAPHRCFSALQRAENSSIRKSIDIPIYSIGCFSALQRAENSSIVTYGRDGRNFYRVSVLFSEPKIPQCTKMPLQSVTAGGFSALQRAENSSIEADAKAKADAKASFSALQRAENSSILVGVGSSRRSKVSVLFSEPKIPQKRQRYAPSSPPPAFQCSSASRKFLKIRPSHLRPSIFPTATITLRRS